MIAFQKILQRPVRALMILWFIWHGAAVGITSYADTIKDNPGADWLKENVRPYFRPYTHLMFNQKQSWRAFSSPGRKVTHYYVDIRDEETNEWEEIARITPDVLPMRQQSHNLKVVLNLDRDKKSRIPLRKTYLRTFCKRNDLEDDSLLRLRYKYYVIPKSSVKNSRSWWEKWEPKWEDGQVTKIRC